MNSISSILDEVSANVLTESCNQNHNSEAQGEKRHKQQQKALESARVLANENEKNFFYAACCQSYLFNNY